MQELIASAAQAEADARVAAATQAQADSEATVTAEETAAADLQSQHTALQQDALEAKGELLSAAAEARLTRGRADLQDKATNQVVKNALERRRKAEALLRSINELTRLAKHAADMAQVERIKAETAAAQPQVTGAWFGPFHAPPCGAPPCSAAAPATAFPATPPSA
mmetsp:Transcript_37210/g.99017  ORF Transcript_37210/g.99017 Transcript_37210/m.99017 type:complete len:166 (+) Transcript_37210:1471-1968(+)